MSSQAIFFKGDIFLGKEEFEIYYWNSLFYWIENFYVSKYKKKEHQELQVESSQ